MGNTSFSSAANTTAQSVTSSAHSMGRDTMLAAATAFTDETPDAFTFTATAATDILTKTAHGMALGLVGQASSTTTLPGGLATTTDYYVIPVTANTFKLAASLEDALAGTAIDITSTGTGTHTFTPTALDAEVEIQRSIDQVTWTAIDTATAITADGSDEWTDDAFPFPFVRQVVTVNAGQLAIGTVLFSK